jgi:hypothetical protein
MMKYRRLFGLAAALLIGLAVVSASCTQATRPIETESDFIGFITEIQPDQEEGICGRISVESHADKIVTKYTITIAEETLIFQEDGNNLRKVSFAALETRQWVEIWFSGPVLESWPMQATAQQVVIRENQ